MQRFKDNFGYYVIAVGMAYFFTHFVIALIKWKGVNAIIQPAVIFSAGLIVGLIIVTVYAKRKQRADSRQIHPHKNRSNHNLIRE